LRGLRVELRVEISVAVGEVSTLGVSDTEIAYTVVAR
jgi:hypothetical protein